MNGSCHRASDRPIERTSKGPSRSAKSVIHSSRKRPASKETSTALCSGTASLAHQAASDPKQWVVLPASVHERLVLDPSATLAELGGHVADDVELVGHELALIIHEVA